MKKIILLSSTVMGLLVSLAWVCIAQTAFRTAPQTASRIIPTIVPPAIPTVVSRVGIDPRVVADTLTARVCHWNSLETKKDSSRYRKEILEGNTPDLAQLEIHASVLDPGMAPHPAHSHADMEELLIVKEGTLRATVNGVTRLLGPGSVAMALPGDMHGFVNAGSSQAVYYVLKFQTRSAPNAQRGRASGGSFLVNWDTLRVQPTDRGEKRELFDRSTALFAKIELHATTLDPGKVSHAPHVHRQEEIIILRHGQVEMQIGDKFYPASAGDLVFLSSGVLHALKNTGAGQCQYYALQWQE